MDPRRVPALILAEIAFLLSLPSADTTISTMAAKGLRSLAHAERQPNVPISTIMSDEDRSKRDPVYEQLGDPRVTVVGVSPFPSDLLYDLTNIFKVVSRRKRESAS